ncbi:BCCT family transporter [Clostridiaceae bacterium]|nr:BCCT family transporter [Clostridiaceae bacterium]RKI15275.1 BCCT family transporter [bacterium 1XD21-70]
MKNKQSPQSLIKQLDLFTTLIPFVCIAALCTLFVLFPDASSRILEKIRFFLGDRMGCYYLLIGLGVFICSLYLAFSRYGSIRLGGGGQPQYSGFRWGSMMFTAGLAADILFYSCCEWLIYASDPHVAGMGALHDWAATYPLFHWGPIPWGFYLVLAVAFGFMLHVRQRHKQKYSEACRALLGRHVDGWAGRLIDLVAVFALLAGTATTFSLATPLLAMAISRLTGIAATTSLTIVILAVVCCIYTCSVYFGMKGIQRSAACCSYLFFLLLAYVFFFGGESRFIVETGITSLGLLAQNFITLSTWTDSLRTTSFPQAMTIFYWAYWMVWCVASPFFIGAISKGRTVRQTILGGYFWGLAGTFTSFIILGNYGLGMQMHGRLDSLSAYLAGGGSNHALYTSIISILEQLPLPGFVLLLLVVCMITFYSTSFDSITLVAASYSYQELKHDEDPDRRVKLFWAVFLILLPIALIFSEKSMANLQSVSIIAAFPVGMIMVLIIASFFKDAGQYLKEGE